MAKIVFGQMTQADVRCGTCEVYGAGQCYKGSIHKVVKVARDEWCSRWTPRVPDCMKGTDDE